MTSESEIGTDQGHYAGAGNAWRRSSHEGNVKGVGGDDTNEVPQASSGATSGADRLLSMSRLEQAPRPLEPVQWPEWVVSSSVGSGKSDTLLRSLTTSGVIAKTVSDRIESAVVQPAPKRREHVVLHQKWEGYVERLTSTGFHALLVDITRGDDEEERTEFDFGEVSDFDRPLIEPGAVFYWSLGYRVRTSGQREGLSVIRFRRMPMWTPQELDEADRAAEATRAVFGWEHEPHLPAGDEARIG
jgi:hypothetical protein